MTAFKLSGFGGMLPAWDDKLLPDGQASNSVNGYLFSGSLTGWRMPDFLRTMTNPNAAFVYRIPTTTTNSEGEDTFNSAITSPSTWLEFNDPDTNVVKSQVVNDIYQRYYVASPTQGVPTYNTLARITNNQNFFNLGLAPPACAPGVEVSGGGNSVQLGPTTNVSGGLQTLEANTCYLLPIVPSGALLLNDIQFSPEQTIPTLFYTAFIYADAGTGGNQATAPGTLLAVGTTNQGVIAGTLAASEFVTPLALQANIPYWIGISTDTSVLVDLGDNFSGSAGFVNTFANGPPGFAPAVTKGLPDLLMFADLTSSAIVEARTYIYTWVSAYGEESPPSPPTLLNGWSNGTWTIFLFNPPTNMLGGTGISNVAILRLYRTVVGTGGAATYFFVTDVSVGSTDPDAIAAVAADIPPCLPPAATFTDNIPDSTVALNTQMPSTNYFAPPANMQGIMSLPNGIYAGFVNNQIWFSVPYLPHAWPPGTVYTVDFPIVGLGFTSGALVVTTSANPWVMNGTNPSNISMIRCSSPEPCLSRGSIVSLDSGVYYQSPNGLIQVVGSGIATNTTILWITLEEWAVLSPQKYFRAVPLTGCYFGFGSVSPPSVSPQDTSVAQQGLSIELNSDAASFTIWPQPGGHRVGFTKLNAPNNFNVSNIIVDPWSGYVMLIQNGSIYFYNWQNATPTMQPYDWTSKTYQQNTKTSFEAFKVWFTVPSGTPSNQLSGPNLSEATDPSWQTLGTNAWAYVLVYADVDDVAGDGAMQLVTAREIRGSGLLYRIQSGFKAENWKIRILGRVPISNVQLATAAKELANV